MFVSAEFILSTLVASILYYAYYCELNTDVIQLTKWPCKTRKIDIQWEESEGKCDYISTEYYDNNSFYWTIIISTPLHIYSIRTPITLIMHSRLASRLTGSWVWWERGVPPCWGTSGQAGWHCHHCTRGRGTWASLLWRSSAGHRLWGHWDCRRPLFRSSLHSQHGNASLRPIYTM